MQFAILIVVGGGAAAAAVKQFLASLSNAAPCVCVKFVVRKYTSSSKMRLDQPNDDDILWEKIL